MGCSHSTRLRHKSKEPAIPHVAQGSAVIQVIGQPSLSSEKNDLASISLSLWQKFARSYESLSPQNRSRNIVFPRLIFHTDASEVICRMILHVSNDIVYAEFQIEADIPLSPRPIYTYPRSTYSATTPTVASFLLQQIQVHTPESTGPLDELVCGILRRHNEG